MKNTINYQGYSVYTKNRINLQKALFNRNMKDHRKPKLKLNLQINNSLIENVKTHLSEDKYREILQNSFGNSSKKEELKTIIHKYVSSKEFSNLFANQVTEYDFDDLSELLVEKISGLDVLQPLADIDTITDIKIIAYNNIWVDDIFKGKYKTDIQFESHNAYLELCHRFAFASNKNISVSKPSIDAIFPYMRVNIVGEDLSPKVTTAIRKVSKKLRLNEEYMIETNYANQLMIDLLKITFGSESHLIAGSTGSGKTELLRHFTKYTKDNSDIIMIEDTPETYLDEIYKNKPISMWVNRQATDDDKKEFGYRYHIRNAVRQNVDYLMIQESRGEESYDILDAAATGHKTSTTLHADNSIDAIQRFIGLCQKAQQQPPSYYGKRITSSFKFGIHVDRIANKRYISQIVEYIDYKDGEVIANVLFEYDHNLNKHVQVGNLTNNMWNKLLNFQKNEMGKDLSKINKLSPFPTLVEV